METDTSARSSPLIRTRNSTTEVWPNCIRPSRDDTHLQNVKRERRRDTDFDVSALRLHQLADDFAQLVGVRELPERRRERRVRAGRGRGRALRGIHVIEAAAEGRHLLCVLSHNRKEEKKSINQSIIFHIFMHVSVS